MATKTAEAEVTLDELVEVVRTGQPSHGIGKMRALATLQQARSATASTALMDVASDAGEEPRFRHMATMGLYELGGTRGAERLQALAEQPDLPRVADIALGLGRIGTAQQMATLERLAELGGRQDKPRIDFATTLLAYRLGVPGHEVRAVPTTQMQDLGRKRARAIEVGKAGSRDVRLALGALDVEPLDVELTSERAARLECGPNSFVWLWSDAVRRRGLASLAVRKDVVGVLFRRRQFKEGFALSALGLATPRRTDSHISIHRASDGRIMYDGSLAPDGSLQLRARDHPGLAAVDIRASLTENLAVEVTTARSAELVPRAKTPKPAAASAPTRPTRVR
jgi:hypothetical protein